MNQLLLIELLGDGRCLRTAFRASTRCSELSAGRHTGKARSVGKSQVNWRIAGSLARLVVSNYIQHWRVTIWKFTNRNLWVVSGFKKRLCNGLNLRISGHRAFAFATMHCSHFKAWSACTTATVPLLLPICKSKLFPFTFLNLIIFLLPLKLTRPVVSTAWCRPVKIEFELLWVYKFKKFFCDPLSAACLSLS